MPLMAFLILDALNLAVNAVTASSVAAGRLILAAQQLEDCRSKNNPYRDQWLPGAVPQNLAWAPDPCRDLQEEVNALQDQAAAGGNQVATQQLGGAPAPQLAEARDPVPNQDPAVPANEFEIPEQGANNQWSPLVPEDIVEMIVQEMGDMPILDEDMEDIQIMFFHVNLWCPWGGPSSKNLKWRFRYQPRNSDWMGKWLP
uniref:Nucleoprotein n=1 Tax=Pacific black duck chaphamaparvovirus TaxID=2759406 RepID=A0A7D7AGP1_9VIRU|nr:nucleoprotein [Pacific black duck chaphamaparvovirus]